MDFSELAGVKKSEIEQKISKKITKKYSILLWAKSIDNFKFKFPGVSDRDNRTAQLQGNSVSDRMRQGTRQNSH